jgi:hypothetical protein
MNSKAVGKNMPRITASSPIHILFHWTKKCPRNWPIAMTKSAIIGPFPKYSLFFNSLISWVPVALAIQALFFWLPNWLWNMLHKQTAINPRAMLAEAGKSRALHGAQREKEVEGLAAFLSDTVKPIQNHFILLFLLLKLVENFLERKWSST